MKLKGAQNLSCNAFVRSMPKKSENSIRFGPEKLMPLAFAASTKRNFMTSGRSLGGMSLHSKPCTPGHDAVRIAGLRVHCKARLFPNEGAVLCYLGLQACVTLCLD